MEKSQRKFLNRRKSIILFVLAFTIISLTQIVNVHYIKAANPNNVSKSSQSIISYSTVYHPDTNWYLPQIRNWIEYDSFTIDVREPEMAVRRTPGYPLFYGAHYFIFGENLTFKIIPYSQGLIYAISAVLLFSIVINITSSARSALLSYLIYCLYFPASIFTQFAITEGLSISFTTISFYWFIKSIKSKQFIHLFFAGFFVTMTFLIRPVLGLLVPVFGVIILINLFDRTLKKLILGCVCFAIPFAVFVGIWTIRNYNVTDGELIFAEKIYHGAPMESGRATIKLRSIIGLFKNPADFIHLQNFLHAINRFESPENLNTLIRNFSKEVNLISNNKLDSVNFNKALKHLAYCTTEKKIALKNGYVLRKDLLNRPCEDFVCNEFDEVVSKYKKENELSYYVLPFLKNFYSYTFNSLTSQVSFLQGDFIICKLIKVVFYFMNLIFVFSVFILSFIPSLNKSVKAVIIIPILAHFFLFFSYVKYYEIRYLVPLIPFYIISFVIVFRFFTKSIFRRFNIEL